MNENKADPLREALKPLAAISLWRDKYQDGPDMLTNDKLARYFTADQVRAARAALAAPQPAAPNPNNLPDTWEYQAETNCVVCSGCMFRYGAEHPDGDGKWTCPNCGDGNGDQSAKPAAPLGGREAILQVLDKFGIEKGHPCRSDMADAILAAIPQERGVEREAREECLRRGIDPDDICADGGVTAWMVVDQETRRHPIEILWREHDLPEWFLGNGGTNTKLYALYDAIRALGKETER